MIGLNPRWQPLLSARAGGEPALIPALRTHWGDVSGLPADSVGRHLERRAQEDGSSVEILDRELPAALLGWLGPLLPLLILVHLVIHVTHLNEIMADDPRTVRHFPWLGLFRDPVAVTVTVITVLLPAVACALLTYRMTATSMTLAAWAGLATALSCLAGGRILLILRNVRRLEQ
jgi:hypothetical protein